MQTEPAVFCKLSRFKINVCSPSACSDYGAKRHLWYLTCFNSSPQAGLELGPSAIYLITDGDSVSEIVHLKPSFHFEIVVVQNHTHQFLLSQLDNLQHTYNHPWTINTVLYHATTRWTNLCIFYTTHTHTYLKDVAQDILTARLTFSLVYRCSLFTQMHPAWCLHTNYILLAFPGIQFSSWKSWPRGRVVGMFPLLSMVVLTPDSWMWTFIHSFFSHLPLRFWKHPATHLPISDIIANFDTIKDKVTHHCVHLTFWIHDHSSFTVDGGWFAAHDKGDSVTRPSTTENPLPSWKTSRILMTVHWSNHNYCTFIPTTHQFCTPLLTIPIPKIISWQYFLVAMRH